MAFLGRSNVGKSSLLNALVGSRQAHVSSTPGRTQAVNFFGLYEGLNATPALVFSDLPGYGYAKVAKSVSSEWGKFIEPYLETRDQLALCLCLMDVNVPPQERDTQLIQYLAALGREYVIVATKADRLSRSALLRATATLQREHQASEVIPLSAKTNAGVQALWSRLQLVRNRRLG